MKNRFLICFIVLFVLILSNCVFALNTISEIVSSEKISSGAVWKEYKNFTDEGWLDINIIEVDLKDKKTKVDLLHSEDGVNTFQTTLHMANEYGAIAAVNGDFFGGNYLNGYGVGLSMSEGEVITSAYQGNKDKNEFASFVLNDKSEALMDYITMDLKLTSKKVSEDFIIHDLNRPSDDYENKPVVLNSDWGEKSIGSFDYLPITELVVKDNKVTKISVNEEAVEIPENGFVVVTAGEKGKFLQDNFKIGMKVSLELEANVDLDKIQTAISGGAVLVRDGKVPESFDSNITGRNPRTALGVSRDGDTLYLVTVVGSEPA